MTAQSIAVEGGFRDPVMAAQSVFRAIMDAMAHPGQIVQIEAGVAPPLPLSATMAAFVLTLADGDTPLWLDPPLAASESVRGWLSFQTGAPIIDDRKTAQFALISDVERLAALGDFALGSDTYPDRSTTVILQVESLSDGEPMTLSGPGIKDQVVLAPHPLPQDFREQWAANTGLFPRGIDLILCAENELAALPRTTRIGEGT